MHLLEAGNDSKGSTLQPQHLTTPLKGANQKRAPESIKIDERNTPNRKFIPPPDAESDPAEREELMMHADI